MAPGAGSQLARLQLRKSKSENRITAFEFRISNFEFRISSSQFPISDFPSSSPSPIPSECSARRRRRSRSSTRSATGASGSRGGTEQAAGCAGYLASFARLREQVLIDDLRFGSAQAVGDWRPDNDPPWG